MIGQLRWRDCQTQSDHTGVECSRVDIAVTSVYRLNTSSWITPERLRRFHSILSE